MQQQHAAPTCSNNKAALPMCRVSRCATLIPSSPPHVNAKADITTLGGVAIDATISSGRSGYKITAVRKVPMCRALQGSEVVLLAHVVAITVQCAEWHSDRNGSDIQRI